jgi:hypothetical protein
MGALGVQDTKNQCPQRNNFSLGLTELFAAIVYFNLNLDLLL